MTTDEAATLLAIQDLTGSVSETARLIKRHKSNVSRALKKARVAVAPEPEQLRNGKQTHDWAEAWGMREQRGLEIVSERIEKPEAETWDIMRWTGIASDKRYREEHPAFGGQAGAVEELVVALLEARRRRLVEGSARITDAEAKDS